MSRNSTIAININHTEDSLIDRNPKHWHRLEELLLNESFLQAASEARTLDPFSRIAAAGHLIKDFGLPSSYYAVITHYLETGEIDPGRIGPKARIFSGYDKTVEPTADPRAAWEAALPTETDGVWIELSHDITQPELVAFVKDNYGLIKNKLEAMAGKRARISSTHFPKRDKEAYDLYLNRKKNGLKVIDIANRFGMSSSQLYLIIKRQRNIQK